MHNDPELDPKFLGIISSDFIKIADNLKEAAYQIKQQSYSDFPIFPISKEEISLGKLLFEVGFVGNEWNYYASMMEEFVQRGLIQKKEDFIKIYKDSDEYCCLFIVDPHFVNFVFIPYPVDE